MEGDSKNELGISVRKQLEKDLRETIADSLQKWRIQNGCFQNNDESLLEHAVSNISQDVIQSEVYKRVSKKVINNALRSQKIGNNSSPDHFNNGERSYSRLSLAQSVTNQSTDDFITVEQILEAAHSLDYKDSLSKLSALGLIGSSAALDYLSVDSVWKVVSKSLITVLMDLSPVVSRSAVKIFVKLLMSSQSTIVRNAYCALLKFIRHQFHIRFGKNCNSNNIVWSVEDPLLQIVVLCNAFQRCVSKHWLRYSKQDVRDTVHSTFRLLSGHDLGEDAFVELWCVFSKVDTDGLWLKHWMYSSVGRMQVIKCIKDFPQIVCFIIKWCLDSVCTQSEKSPIPTSSEIQLESKSVPLFLHFINILSLLLEHYTGRQSVSSILSNHNSMNWLQFLHTLTERAFHNGHHAEFECIIKAIGRVCSSLCTIDGQSSAEEAVFQALIDIISYPLNVYFNHPVGCRQQDIVMIQCVVKTLANVSCYEKGRRVLLMSNDNEECLGILLFKYCISMLCDSKMYDYSSQCLLEDLLSFCSNFLVCPRNLLLVTSSRLEDMFSNCIQSLHGNLSKIFDSENESKMSLALTLLQNPLSVSLFEDANKLVHWMSVVLKHNEQKDKMCVLPHCGVHISKCLVVLLSNASFTMHLVNTEGLHSLATLVWKRFLYNCQCKQQSDASDFEDSFTQTMYNRICVLYSYPGALFVIQESLNEESQMCNSLLLLPKSLCLEVEAVCNDTFLHMLGLRVLCTLVSCLKTSLYLRSHTYALNFLIDYINSCTSEDGTVIVDEFSILCNHCIVRMLSIGSAGERNIPPKHVGKPENFYPWPFVTCSSLPKTYTKCLQTHHSELDALLYQIFTKLNTNTTVMVHIINSLHEVLSMSKDAAPNKIFLLLEKSVIHGGPRKASLPYIDQDMLKIDQDLSPEEQYGVQLTVGYAKLLNLAVENSLTNFESAESALEWLVMQVKENLFQVHEAYVFDFFVATVFLLSNCDPQKSWLFLQHFVDNKAAPFIWTDLLSCSPSNKANITKASLCQYFEILLKESVPSVYSAFQMCHYPSFLIYEQWTRQCFWNHLNWTGICTYFLLCILKSGDFSLYFCIAIMKHLEQNALEKAQSGALIQFFKEESIADFDALEYLEMMNSLAERYHDMIMKDFTKHFTLST